MRWGDTLYAGLAGSTAQWSGAEPAAWQIDQAMMFPEPMPLGMVASAQQTYDGIFGTSGRAEERRREVCAALPPLIRAVIPECRDVTTGEPGERFLQAGRDLGTRLVLLGIGAGIVLLGVAALIFGDGASPVTRVIRGGSDAAA